MKLIYLGHSAFYIESGDFKALIDPFIQGNPQCPFELDDFPQLSHILVTHGHADHIGDTVALAQKTGALVVCNHELGHYFQGQGLKNVHTMHIGGRFDRFKMTPAWHGSSVEIDGKLYDGGTPAGFLIDLDGIKIYHAGDLHWWAWPGDTKQNINNMTANYQREIAALHALLNGTADTLAASSMGAPLLDLAFLPLDGRLEENYALGIEYFLQAIPVHHVFPMHFWDKYDVISNYLEKYNNSNQRQSDSPFPPTVYSIDREEQSWTI